MHVHSRTGDRSCVSNRSSKFVGEVSRLSTWKTGIVVEARVPVRDRCRVDAQGSRLDWML